MLGNFIDQSQLKQWKSSLYEYEKNKRTKKPFGKDPSIYDVKVVHSAQIKEKQREFNPVLQKYNNQNLQKKTQKMQEIKQNLKLANYLNKVKSNHNYDIVNLYPLNDEVSNPQKQYNDWSKQKNKNNPIRNLYNIINNQYIPQSYIKNRRIKVNQRQNSKRIYSEKLKQRDYDFIKGRYLENNDEKLDKQAQQRNEKIKQKLSKSYHFDNIFQRYYNPQVQEAYQNQMNKSQLVHGKDHLQRLPPSYKSREPLTFDYSQEKLSPALKKIIEKQKESLRKNQLKYIIEEEYKKRNQEQFQKRQKILKNRVHEGKIFQTMAKQFNIINNKIHQLDRSQFYQKNFQGHPYSYEFLRNQNAPQKLNSSRNSISNSSNNEKWESFSQAQSVRSKSSFDSNRYSIKSGGFN